MGLKKDRIVVVTGASRGIGKGVALALGAGGATVYVTGRSTEEGQTGALPGTVTGTASEIAQRGAVRGNDSLMLRFHENGQLMSFAVDEFVTFLDERSACGD